MASSSVLRWIDGRGWLVLAGGGSEFDSGEVRSLALGRAAADGGVACVPLSADPYGGDALLDDIDTLGAPSSYIVDVLSEDDLTVQARLSEAGVVVVESAPTVEEARSALIGAALDGIQAAFANGAVVLFEGACAGILGSWILNSAGQVGPGVDWLEGALVLASAQDVAERARPVLDEQPAAVVIGIEPGSALALGPDGQIEVWGARQVKVVLGSAYST
jgi:hypothetical protein